MADIWLGNVTEDDMGDEFQVSRVVVEADSDDDAVRKLADMGWCVLSVEGPNPTPEAGPFLMAYEVGKTTDQVWLSSVPPPGGLAGNGGGAQIFEEPSDA